jgi:hypothetical protein
MNQIIELLSALTRPYVEQAIIKLDQNISTLFAESIKYDLLIGARRYPPKRVAGLALELMTGQRFGPEAFKGGEESACFLALRRCGFTIVPKADEQAGDLRSDLAEVLKLQQQYVSSNSPEMARRGLLIRREIPERIRAHAQLLEPIFTRAGFSLEVEGSDGIGRKVESPWIRIFDGLMSPSATTGWYVVIHFSRSGERLFVTLGCGSTTFHQGSLIRLPREALEASVAWARSIAFGSKLNVAGFEDAIHLEGNDLSQQFERSTAFAMAFEIRQFGELLFWEAIERLCAFLVTLYESERLGKAPLSEQPEVIEGVQEIGSAVSPAWRGRSQGRGLSYEERVAIEERAMSVALGALENAGFCDIKDVHADRSYDFSASRHGIPWAVEVKGTTSSAMDAFLLTAAERRLHEKLAGTTALILVSDICLHRSEDQLDATGGKAEVYAPWSMDDWSFEATAFKVVKTGGSRTD